MYGTNFNANECCGGGAWTTRNIPFERATSRPIPRDVQQVRPTVDQFEVHAKQSAAREKEL
jgi:hypothetical protein